MDCPAADPPEDFVFFVSAARNLFPFARFSAEVDWEEDCMKTRLAGVLVVLAVAIVWIAAGCHLIHADPHVAFLGDSITQQWHYPRADFGIHGNTTAQMLTRFPDVIPGRNFREVVIQGGTNDLLLGIDNQVTIRNLEQMGEATLQQNAEPVLCEIPPIFHSFNPDDRKDYGPEVIELNRRIAELAQSHDWKLVDYYTPIRNHPGYSADGVHMKRRGYLAMEIALLRQLPRQ
jgi:lysophospholipase L1-like esterase